MRLLSDKSLQQHMGSAQLHNLAYRLIHALVTSCGDDSNTRINRKQSFMIGVYKHDTGQEHMCFMYSTVKAMPTMQRCKVGMLHFK